MSKKNGIDEFTAQMIMADDTFSSAATEFVNDPEFAQAWDNLDMGKLTKQYDKFVTSATAYNHVHRMERRLWSLKMGKGYIPSNLETKFRQRIPSAISQYSRAFHSAEGCLDALESAEFGPVLQRHLHKFTGCLFDKDHPFREAMERHFTQMGCSAKMIAEFEDAFPGAGHDPIAVIGNGDFSNLRYAMQEGIEAQVKALRHTHDHGFDYLHGRCGPPAWAVTASQVLAYFGISMSAWVVISIVSVVIVLLITLCATNSLPSWVLSKCDYLSLKLNFTF